MDDSASLSLNADPSDKEPLLRESRRSIEDGASDAPVLTSIAQKPVYRYLLLIFICFTTFGSYYCYDIPGATTTPIQDLLNISKVEYEWMYSIYSWPNTVQVFFGGFMLDRFFGLRLGAIIFCGLVLAGQVVFSLGLSFKSYWLALAGRFIFGLGGESLTVAQTTYVAKWFKGKEMALAFGIALSFSRIGSAVNFNVSPSIATSINEAFVGWVGVMMCGISLLACFGAFFMDRKGDREGVVEDVSADEPVKLTDVKYFPLSIWLIYLICVTFYVSVFVWVTMATDFMEKKYGYSKKLAGHVTSVPYLMSAGMSPFLGFGVDKIGHSVIWILLATAGLTGVHAYFAFLKATPWVGVAGMGVCYSVCAAALWPGVALIVEPHLLGSAYGLMTALQNLGLAVGPLAAGAVQEGSGYKVLMVMFMCIAGASFVFTVLLWLADSRAGGLLNVKASVLAARLAALNVDLDKEPVLVDTESLLQPKTMQQHRNAFLMRIGVGPHVPR